MTRHPHSLKNTTLHGVFTGMHGIYGHSLLQSPNQQPPRSPVCYADKVFPVFGFGGQRLPNPVSHCFPLGPNPTGECQGVEGILMAYRWGLGGMLGGWCTGESARVGGHPSGIQVGAGENVFWVLYKAEGQGVDSILLAHRWGLGRMLGKQCTRDSAIV